jgi:phenylalanyl-tRNA synthetase beta chain
MAMPRYAHIEPFVFEKTEKPVWADDVVWLNIKHGEQRIGNLALLSKKASLKCDIKNSAVMIFELDLNLLKPYTSRTNEFIHLPEYPMTDYDVSLLFDLSIKWEEIQGVITGKTDELQRGLSFVDEYKGHQVPEGKKSVTFRLVIGSRDKTLTSDEIEKYANIVIKRLKKALGAEMR